TPQTESCLTPEDDDCDGAMSDGVEDCATPGDDDCNNVANDHCAFWSERFGGGANDRALALAIDPQGNVLLAGESSGNINLGGGVLSGNGGEDVLVAKYAPNGTHIWSRRFGNGNDQRATTIATDPMGNVIVAGIFQGTIAFSPSPADTHT